jgi:hypothetical protein
MSSTQPIANALGSTNTPVPHVSPSTGASNNASNVTESALEVLDIPTPFNNTENSTS